MTVHELPIPADSLTCHLIAEVSRAAMLTPDPQHVKVYRLIEAALHELRPMPEIPTPLSDASCESCVVARRSAKSRDGLGRPLTPTGEAS